MEPQDLIQDYLDGELTEQQFVTMSEWLAQDEAHREAFVRASVLDSQLYRLLTNADLHQFLEDVDIHAIQDQLQDASAGQPDVLLPITDADESRKTGVTLGTAFSVLSQTGVRYAGAVLRRHAVGFAMAAAVLIAVVITLVVVVNQGPDRPTVVVTPPQPPQQENTPVALAYVTGSDRAVWSGPGFAMRDALTQGSYRLERGSVVLEMTSGTQALIHGPAAFSLTGSNQVELDAGSLDALVPRRAIGFTVETPGARIVDIGTEFSVRVDERAQATVVAVHTGQVLAAPNADASGDPAPRTLRSGQAARIDAGARVSEAAYEPGGFAQALKTSRYRPTITGGPSRFDPETPSDLSQTRRASDKLQVYLERPGLVLDRAAAVNLAPGMGWPLADSKAQRRVEAGTAVDVYLVHVDPSGLDYANDTYTLTFGRRILGVMAKPDLLIASDQLASGDEQRLYPQDAELRGVEAQDTLRLSADGLTLELNLQVEHKLDQVRLLVEALPAAD